MKLINNKISLIICWTSLLISAQTLAATVIDRSDKAQQACEELSKESLDEMGLGPTNWRSHSSSDSGGFSVEGQWQTKNGVYIVECEVGFNQTIDQVELKIIKK